MRLEIEKVRREIEVLHTECKAVGARLLKWQIGIGVALGAAMVTGFGLLIGIMGFH